MREELYGTPRGAAIEGRTYGDPYLAVQSQTHPPRDEIVGIRGIHRERRLAVETREVREIAVLRLRMRNTHTEEQGTDEYYHVLHHNNTVFMKGDLAVE